MRSRIFLYLFIFAVLYIIFQYSNAKGIYENQESQINNLQLNVERYKSENDSLVDVVTSLKDFTLTGNAYASEYFASKGIAPNELETLIENEILDRNKADADNDLVPFAGMEGLMRINDVQVVNSEWILATFTDGKFWGEIFLTYEIDEDNTLILNTKEQVLHASY